MSAPSPSVDQNLLKPLRKTAPLLAAHNQITSLVAIGGGTVQNRSDLTLLPWNLLHTSTHLNPQRNPLQHPHLD